MIVAEQDAQLPDDPSALKALLLEREATITQQAEEIGLSCPFSGRRRGGIEPESGCRLLTAAFLG